MSFLQAVVLGIVQGLGEFLPISSSAHLVLTPWLFDWPDPGLMFDVALHVGTMLAVITYFWRELVEIVYFGIKRPKSKEGTFFWYLVVASIPGAVLGFMFEEQAETIFRNPLLIAGTLASLGLLLWWADKRGRKVRQISDLTWTDSIVIGISQGLAIIPGVSRSGITMTSGLLIGLGREAAARFSFLMSVPIISGAAVYKLRDLKLSMVDPPFVVGVLVAAIVGYLAIRFLLQYLRRGSYLVFAIYRFALAAAIVFFAWKR